MDEFEKINRNNWFKYIQSRLEAIENSMRLILTSFIIIVGILIAQLFKVLDEDIFPELSKGELSSINLLRAPALFSGIMILIIFLYFIFRSMNNRRLKIKGLIETQI